MNSFELFLSTIEVPSGNQDVFIWGAGNTALLLHQGMIRADLYRFFNVKYFIDSKLAGTTICGLPVKSPEVLDDASKKDVFVLICTANQWMLHDIEHTLDKKGISHCLLEAAIIKAMKTSFLEVSELLDDYSRKIYFEVLLQRMTLNSTKTEVFGGEPYFGIPEFCSCNPRDIVFDCGAYVGDSVERYLWRMEQFDQIVAFEPNAKNFRALSIRFNRLRKEWALSEETLVAAYAGVDRETAHRVMTSYAGGLGSIATNPNDVDSDSVEFWAIDDFVMQLMNNRAPTYIKADIESFEYRMLEGASKTIKEAKPRLAICIYHNAVDMFSIPLLVKSINPDYHLSVRHHSFGWAETVLYAY